MQARDGASRAIGANGDLPADPQLLAALVAAGDGAATGRIVSTDLYYAPAPETDALAVDLTTAAILAVAARDGAAAAAVLAVSDRIASGDRLDPDGLESAEVELGRVGAAAFSP